MCFNIEQEFQLKKIWFHDPEGHKNYVTVFQEMTVNKLKLIDSHFSSKKVGSTQLYLGNSTNQHQYAQINLVEAHNKEPDTKKAPKGTIAKEV